MLIKLHINLKLVVLIRLFSVYLVSNHPEMENKLVTNIYDLILLIILILISVVNVYFVVKVLVLYVQRSDE